jgi:hypothetical protein
MRLDGNSAEKRWNWTVGLRAVISVRDAAGTERPGDRGTEEEIVWRTWSAAASTTWAGGVATCDGLRRRSGDETIKESAEYNSRY